MKDVPEPLELKEEEVRRDLERIKEAVGEDVYERFSAIVETLLFLTRLLERKKMTIKRLRRIIFGSSSEKMSNVLPDEAQRGDKPKEKKKRKGGKGRNGAAAYTGAEKVEVSHDCLSPGDPCPEERCKGRVYEQKKPAVLVRLSGQAPVGATVYELQKLRCNLCGKLFTAEVPPEAGDQKYDEETASIIALLHYGSGLPFNRLQGLQNALGVPLAAATQWKIVETLAETLEPVYQELIRQAAQGEVVHNDDTSMKILELMKENEEKRRAREDGEVGGSG